MTAVPDGLPKRHRPGSRWRVLWHRWDRGGNVASSAVYSEHWAWRDRVSCDADVVVNYPSELDEVVIDDWLHLEQMSKREWWLRVGDYTINVWVGERGQAESVRFEEEVSK